MIPQSVSQANELFFVVDDNDTPLTPLPRKNVHGHGIWHRTAHIWIVNKRGEVLCEQRSKMKELSPGKWNSSFGGHLAPGETYLEGARRELNEELGLEFTSDAFKLWKIYKNNDPLNSNNEFQGVFIVRWNGDIDKLLLQDGEVERVAWYRVDEIKKMLLDDPHWIKEKGYKIELLADLSQV